MSFGTTGAQCAVTNSTPISLALRQTTLQGCRWVLGSIRSKLSGIPTTEFTASLAPSRDRLRTVQSMVERPALNTILPPLRVVRRCALRCSVSGVTAIGGLLAPVYEQQYRPHNIGSPTRRGFLADGLISGL